MVVHWIRAQGKISAETHSANWPQEPTASPFPCVSFVLRAQDSPCTALKALLCLVLPTLCCTRPALATCKPHTHTYIHSCYFAHCVLTLCTIWGQFSVPMASRSSLAFVPWLRLWGQWISLGTSVTFPLQPIPDAKQHLTSHDFFCLWYETSPTEWLYLYQKKPEGCPFNLVPSPAVNILLFPFIPAHNYNGLRWAPKGVNWPH